MSSHSSRAVVCITSALVGALCSSISDTSNSKVFMQCDALKLNLRKAETGEAATKVDPFQTRDQIVGKLTEVISNLVTTEPMLRELRENELGSLHSDLMMKAASTIGTDEQLKSWVEFLTFGFEKSKSRDIIATYRSYKSISRKNISYMSALGGQRTLDYEAEQNSDFGRHTRLLQASDWTKRFLEQSKDHMRLKLQYLLLDKDTKSIVSALATKSKDGKNIQNTWWEKIQNMTPYQIEVENSELIEFENSFIEDETSEFIEFESPERIVQVIHPSMDGDSWQKQLP